MPNPPVLQEHHFIQSDGEWSQTLRASTRPLLWETSGFSLSSLPNRIHTDPLLLWVLSQPKGVVKPGGKMVAGGVDGMLSPHQPLLLLLLWDSCPLVDWGKKFDPICPGPGALSADVWPIPVCTKFYLTQPCLPVPLRRIQVRPLYLGKQVSLVATQYVWLSTFRCGACSFVLVCWCVEKEAWVSRYKKASGPATMTLIS